MESPKSSAIREELKAEAVLEPNSSVAAEWRTFATIPAYRR